MTDQEELARVLTSVFGRHGAVPMSSAVIGFRDADTSANAAAFLDRSGAVLALRHEMRAPFAAWLARQVPFYRFLLHTPGTKALHTRLPVLCKASPVFSTWQSSWYLFAGQLVQAYAYAHACKSCIEK